MTERVKRRYRSPRREEQAEQTRERILDTAAELFGQRGYGSTSIAAIATAAGVAAETIYSHFGNKRTLLGDLVQRAVRGDDARNVPDQQEPRALAADSDHRRQLARFTADITPRLERAAPIVAVVREAARGEPEIATLLETLHAQRKRNLRTLIDALAANGPLRLPADAAVDSLWAVASPEMHQLLRHQAEWSAERYTEWLTATLEALLLPPPAER